MNHSGRFSFWGDFIDINLWFYGIIFNKRKINMTKLAQKVFGLVLMITFAASAQAAVVATVNGKVITDDDLQGALSNLPESQKSAVMKDKNTRTQLIDSLVDQELLVQDATSKKIEDTKEYKQALVAFRKQALVNLLVQKQLAPKVTEAATQSYYNANKAKYSTDQVHAQHILVSTLAEADAVLAEVKKPGVDFQKVAEQKSKDPSAKNNRGDVGFFAHDTYDPAFADAAFSGKPGDIVGPVKTSFGYHIIKIVDRKLGKVPDYVEVEQKVRSDLQRSLVEKYVADLKRKAKIKI
jgi:peptidyl-prolyl cis-trans isomerase C